MKNITLNIIGQRILSDVLKEKEDIIKMDILFFETLDDYLKNIKDNVTENIIVTHLSNFELVEKSKRKINSPIFYLTSKTNNINTKTKLQKYELILIKLLSLKETKNFFLNR